MKASYCEVNIYMDVDMCIVLMLKYAVVYFDDLL